MTLSRKRIAGSGYIILNILRAMNIIGLLTVVTASIVMLVNAFTTNISHFFFFDAVSHVITFFVSIFLVMTEVGIFRAYFARNWPLFGPDHGFVMLGLAMTVLGINILGNMNKESMSQKRLGIAFWRIVLGSAIIVLILGVFNIIASYVFRDKPQGVTARRVRSQGATAATSQPSYYTISSPELKQKGPLSVVTSFPTGSSAPSIPASSVYSPVKSTSSPRRSTAFRFNPVRTFRAARDSILPSYQAAAKKNSISSPVSVREMQISAPTNINPQFAHLIKPDNAHHPSRRDHNPPGEGPDGGWV